MGRELLQEGVIGEPLGVVSTMRALPSRSAVSAAASSSAERALLTWIAWMPKAVSLSHWSFINAISGETTTVRPSSSSAGN